MGTGQWGVYLNRKGGTISCGLFCSYCDIKSVHTFSLQELEGNLMGLRPLVHVSSARTSLGQPFIGTLWCLTKCLLQGRHLDWLSKNSWVGLEVCSAPIGWSRMWCRTRQKSVSLADTASPQLHSIHHHGHKCTIQKNSNRLSCFIFLKYHNICCLIFRNSLMCTQIRLAATDRNRKKCHPGKTL